MAAEQGACYSGVKLIWSRCAAPDEAHPDYQRQVRIWHGGPGRTRLEFLRPDGGPAHVVVENGEQRWFYSPRRQEWRPVAWREPEPRLALLLKNYRVLSGSVQRIAGRPARMIQIEPRFPGNPRKHAWLDLATGVILRADLFDSSGRLVSRSQFLAYTPERALPVSLFAPPDASLPANSHERAIVRTSMPAEEHASFAPLMPHYLPRGYVLDRITSTRSRGVDLVRARFTDGLNTLSLVQWRGAEEPQEGGHGRFWSPEERIRFSVGPVHATLAGDLAAAELRRIAGSLRAPRSGALVTRK